VVGVERDEAHEIARAEGECANFLTESYAIDVRFRADRLLAGTRSDGHEGVRQENVKRRSHCGAYRVLLAESNMNPDQMATAVAAARAGDLAAFALLVEATQGMAYAVALRVLREDADARDVVQDAYLAAFKRLAELIDVQAFPGWLRRIVVTTSLNHRRRTRSVWLELTERVSPPILDAQEQCWSDEVSMRLGSYKESARTLSCRAPSGQAWASSDWRRSSTASTMFERSRPRRLVDRSCCGSRQLTICRCWAWKPKAPQAPAQGRPARARSKCCRASGRTPCGRLAVDG